jgi:hypothetical protein
MIAQKMTTQVQNVSDRHSREWEFLTPRFFNAEWKLEK